MQRFVFFTAVLFSGISAFTGCQPQAGNMNANMANTNANVSNSLTNTANTNAANANTVSSVTVETKEPEQYSAMVALKMEATGENNTAQLPAIGANVARNGADRRMEFTLPTGEKIVYLDKNGTNYAIFPNRKQYAELNQESLGFEVRRLLMPEQIVNQVKAMQGVQRVGEENVNGRQVVKYAYSGTANTQTQAGNVATESFILIDKETGLPLHSETVSQSQTGGNVQGYKGLRFVTDMTDIKTTVDPTLFNPPTDFQKIDAEQVKAQANLIFNAVAALIGQAMKQAQPNPSPMASPSGSPMM
ncbi:MAG TPA: hypothetical protein PKY59_01940 [Pyrinomonadaceae bacterium]|nr:hypothetical protein [Pyrinomonadaceae bacterium]